MFIYLYFGIFAIPKYPPTYFVRNVFTLLGHVSKKHSFQLHIYRKSHIIRISYSKYQFIILTTPTMPKYFQTKTKLFEELKTQIGEIKFLFYYLYKLHNSYFVYFMILICLYTYILDPSIFVFEKKQMWWGGLKR